MSALSCFELWSVEDAEGAGIRGSLARSTTFEAEFSISGTEAGNLRKAVDRQRIERKLRFAALNEVVVRGRSAMDNGIARMIRRLIPVAVILIAAAVWMFGFRRMPDSDALPSELQVPQPATKLATTEPEHPAVSPVFEPLRRTGRLASWNINFGNQRVEQVAAELEKADADVVCLQETTRQSEDYLVSALKDRYPHHEAFGHQGLYYAERFLVLSKEPWQSIRYVPPSRRFFGCVLMEAIFCGTPVQIVSVHLAPFTGNGVDSLAGLYAAMGQTEVDHQHEIQAALELVSLKAPVVILGDFNSLAGMIAPRTLKEAGLADAFETLEPSAD